MAAMTSLERVVTTLEHKIPDRVPVGLHNYLMAGRMRGGSLKELLQDGEALAEAQLLAWREFGHDMIMSENGVTAEAQAMGCEIEYQDQIAPHVQDPVIKTPDDIDKLEVPDPETTFPLDELLKTTRILVKETGGKVFIQGRADQGPMALVMAICGPEAALLMTMEPGLRPKLLQLLDKCIQMNIALGAAQRRAGAHGTCIGALGCSLISPEMYVDLELPGNQAFCDAMKRIDCYPFVHTCGKEDHLLEDLIKTGAGSLELDPGTTPRVCKDTVRGRMCVTGMLDPASILRNGGRQQVIEHTLEVLSIMGPGGEFIMGPGCCLPIETSVDNIKTVMECVNQAGWYAPDGSLPYFKDHSSPPR